MRLPPGSLSRPAGEVREADVVVLGAGPAGAAAATVLAQEGRDVLLVRPSRTPEGFLGESVPPSARKLLAEIDALDAVEAAGFVPNVGNTVHWAGGAPRIERFGPGGHGVHVDRRGLEDVLVPVAARSGARVLGAVARRASRHRDLWSVECRASDGRALRIRAPWIVDATGRHGFLARGLGRRTDPRTRTTALVGRWRVAGPAADGVRGHTVIDSDTRGWCWSVPLGENLRCFAAMLDPRHTGLEGADLRSLLAEAGRAGRGIGPLLEGAVPVGPVRACPATLYRSERYTDEGMVLAGDAGSFIDPLSSYGVKKALSSGWMAALVVHTALGDPALADAAREAHERREHDVVRRYHAGATTYLEEAAGAHRHPYWTERLDAAREALDPMPGAPAPAALAAAYERIRSEPRLAARVARCLARVDAPAVAGRRIVLEEQLTLGGPTRFRHHGPVDLRALVELAPAHDEVPGLWTAYRDRAGEVALPDFLRGLSFAFAAGLLEWNDDSSAAELAPIRVP